MTYSATKVSPLSNVLSVSCRPSNQMERFVALAESIGIATDSIDAQDGVDISAALLNAGASGHVLVVDLASLANASPATIESVLEAVLKAETDVLLLVTDVGNGVSRLLSEATDNIVTSAFRKPRSEGSACKFNGVESAELNEFSYPTSSSTALCLSVGGEAFESIMSIDGDPSFGKVVDSHQSRALYVWSTPEIFDLYRPLSGEVELECASDEYIPGIIFLRATLRERCWHTHGLSAAVIVDDPLLRQKYGALDFGQLLASARRHSYHVTLAFIPWNYWRTRSRDAALFREHRDVFSVCVHGNDHTAGEFQSDDFQSLCATLREAKARFEEHESQTGIAHDWLMVFPQERYSVQALRALANNGRFAAVSNTRCIPDDSSATGKLCGADLLLPATDAWFGMPILKRHYLSEGMEKFALALFLGRPAILATHHQFFRQGPAMLEEFVAAIRRLNPRVDWQPLTKLLRRLCWQRHVSGTVWDIRFFSDEFEIEPCSHPRNYSLSRKIPHGMIVESVTVNDMCTDFSVCDGVLRFELVVARNSGIVVKIHSIESLEAAPRAVSRMYRANVALRRFGSELRDNFILRSRIMSGIARNFVR